MGRNQLDRYLDVVEDSFGAAAAASEEIAADDLALSFLQDLDLAGALCRMGPLECCLPGKAFRPVVEIGNDYAVVDLGFPVVLPVTGGKYRSTEAGDRPKVVDRSLVGLLRSLVRYGVKGVVEHRGEVLQGCLTRAGRDHLGVRNQAREELLPLAAVVSVGLPEEQKWRY